MKREDFSPAELEDLTAEELAALDEDDGADGANVSSDDEIEQEDTPNEEAADEDPENGAGESADDQGEGQEQPGRDDGAEPDTGEENGGEADDQESDEPAAPILVAQDTTDAQARLTEIESEKLGLAEKFDNGDLTTKEYQAALNDLLKEERKLEFKIHDAELAQQLETQRRQNEWMAEVARFTVEKGRYKKGNLAWQALDTVVRSLAQEPGSAQLTGREILEKAHAVVASEFGWDVEPTEKEVKEVKEAAKPVTKPQPKVKHAAPPPSLGKLPAAEGNDTQGGKYASLDRLADTDPMKYEAALEKMSVAERNNYLTGR